MKIKNPRSCVKSKDNKIVDLCRGKRVLHIWACDSPYTKDKKEKNMLLYDKIDDVCNYQLGIDIDTEQIAYLNKFNYKCSEIIYYNMNDEWWMMNDLILLYFERQLNIWWT